ncbi:hypothetical protein RN001_015199 [Aquatica leii]|uniref:Peptidase S1 domain-containing protein n=1 Tax=Aquatica leii TaxID=1421715 RepID=A0AAN7PZ54_9COLE|nr:hypothetical protein RN001_015199 [Aquatica leii]
MNFLLIIAIAVCGFACTNGRTLLKDKIIGGTLASRGQFPHQIYQRVDGFFYCGGSIIDKNTILTAAHCVDGTDRKSLNIVAGSNKLDQGGVWYSVSRYIIHPNWNPDEAANDLAVIKVTTPIQFSTFVQPVVLNYNFVPGGPECTLSGWGLTKYPGTTPPNDLLYFRGNVVDLNQCKGLLPSAYPITDKNICAMARTGIGACSGDSGGPLVSNNKQIGITSWVIPCGLGVPDVYTRVSYFASWIQAQQAKIN